MNARVGLYTSLFFLYTSGVVAQPESVKAPKEFFPKGYTSEVSPGITQAGVPREKQQQRGPQSNTSRRPVSASKDKREKLLLVTLLVNSLNKAHFTQVLEAAFRLHDQKLASVIQIQHVGDYRNVTPELEAACRKRGIQAVELTEVPLGFETALSPAWNILTPKGRYVAQGVVSIERLINEWGEYDPKLAVELQSGGSLEKL